MKKTIQTVFCSLLVITGLCVSARGQGTTNKDARASQPAATEPKASARKSGEWKDPEKVVQEIFYDGIPIEEVVEDLKREFSREFDILLPFGLEEKEQWNWRNTAISLRLKNVKASEIFEAMNLVFEAAGTPLRWELMMNGRRPTALLRPAHAQVAGAQSMTSATAGLEKPMVFFVGDLVAASPAEGMTFEQVVETVMQVCLSSIGRANISTHKEAQLLIVRGTGDDLAFVTSLLSALRAKTEVNAHRQRVEKATQPGQKNKEQPSQ